jgi:tRNA pseudouridine38-40 synthase
MLTIAYDGSDYRGWQKQEPPGEWAMAHRAIDALPAGAEPGDVRAFEELPDRPGRVALRTVQHVVERAVRSVVRQPAALLGASRTDSGVHAKGQVAAFTSWDAPAGERYDEGRSPDCAGGGWPASRGVDRLIVALNGRLPDDCQVVDARVIHPTFNPIGDCTSKGYSYTIHAARRRPLFDRRFVHHVWEALDVGAMQEAAKHLVGEHDFASFAAAGHGRQSTVRSILSCAVGRTDADRVRIDVSGTGFLYNMVRIIAGTLVDAGRGRTNPSDVPAIIAAKDRRRAGVTLPAAGLCLEWIRYPDPPAEWLALPVGLREFTAGPRTPENVSAERAEVPGPSEE